MNIEDALIETPDGAFVSANLPNKLEEKELYPYSLMRQTVAVGLGVRHKAVDGFFDSVVMAWLCNLDEDAVLEAQRNRNESLKMAFRWAENLGYSITNFQPLLRFYEKVCQEIERSSNAVVVGDGNSEKNFGGQLAS